MMVQLSNPNESLDDLDRRLLARLMRHGRATWSDLAVELGLTAPAIAQRVRRMEDRGVISGFTALASPAAIAPVCAFAAGAATPAPARDRGAPTLAERLAVLDAVQECHYLSGADEYLLKIRCASLEALRLLVSETLPREAGVSIRRVQVVLGTLKETPALALPPATT